jgi:hypothetical protein
MDWWDLSECQGGFSEALALLAVSGFRGGQFHISRLVSFFGLCPDFGLGSPNFKRKGVGTVGSDTSVGDSNAMTAITSGSSGDFFAWLRSDSIPLDWVRNPYQGPFPLYGTPVDPRPEFDMAFGIDESFRKAYLQQDIPVNYLHPFRERCNNQIANRLRDMYKLNISHLFHSIRGKQHGLVTKRKIAILEISFAIIHPNQILKGRRVRSSHIPPMLGVPLNEKIARIKVIVLRMHGGARSRRPPIKNRRGNPNNWIQYPLPH